MSKANKSEKVPKNMQPIFDLIVDLTDKVCNEYLNEEYAQLSRKATAALCRKRPSPLLQGKIDTWACGIVYAMGFVNFLFDKANDPYLSANDLCSLFGVSKSTGAAKSKVVRDSLNLFQMHPKWCLPSQLEDNPVAWMIQVDGIMVDVRNMPRQIQEIAYKKGLIPYIPEG